MSSAMGRRLGGEVDVRSPKASLARRCRAFAPRWLGGRDLGARIASRLDRLNAELFAVYPLVALFGMRPEVQRALLRREELQHLLRK